MRYNDECVLVDAEAGGWLLLFRAMENNLTENKQKAVEPDFFLPDLCHGRAVLFLVLVAELIAIVLELAGSGLRHFSWYDFAFKSLFMQWAMLSSAALLCQLRPWLGKLRVAYAAGFSYGLILLVVMALDVSGQWLVNGAIAGTGNWSIDLWTLLDHAIITAVLAGITLRYFYLTQALNLRQRAELQARIQALQSRIRPHFLFNSMNIIASLIAVDQDAAETAVEDLSALFRASLNEATEVPFEQELDLCRRYARIEQQRLGDRLTLDWQVDDIPAQLMIPSLSLQPLLENAIYHGIQHRVEGGQVRIEASIDDGCLTVAVINPLTASTRGADDGNHMAHHNIDHRLQALYGSSAGLHIEERDGEYRAIIQYPVDLDRLMAVRPKGQQA